MIQSAFRDHHRYLRVHQPCHARSWPALHFAPLNECRIGGVYVGSSSFSGSTPPIPALPPFATTGNRHHPARAPG